MSILNINYLFSITLLMLIFVQIVPLGNFNIRIVIFLCFIENLKIALERKIKESDGAIFNDLSAHKRLISSSLAHFIYWPNAFCYTPKLDIENFSLFFLFFLSKGSVNNVKNSDAKVKAIQSI